MYEYYVIYKTGSRPISYRHAVKDRTMVFVRKYFVSFVTIGRVPVVLKIVLKNRSIV